MLYEFEHFGLSGYTKKEYGENFNFPKHLHKSFEFITVLSGEMQITVDDKRYIVHKGEALLIFPNQMHEIKSSVSRHMLYIFSGEMVKMYTSKILGKIPQNNMFIPDKNLIEGLCAKTQDSSIFVKKGMLYLLCDEFDRCAMYLERKEDDKDLLYKIFKFVEANYNKDCSLKSLTDETGFSYSYLSRYFKKIIGVSFNKYVNQYRISNACYLLTNSDYSVLQCALESGYDSLRSFNRNFMDLLSVTPNTYRKNFKKNTVSFF